MRFTPGVLILAGGSGGGGGGFTPTVAWDPARKSSHIVLSGSGPTNKIATRNADADAYGSVYATTSKNSGKRYFEIGVDQMNASVVIGFATSFGAINNFIGSDTSGWCYVQNGSVYTNNTPTSGLSAYTTGDYLMGAIDIDAGKIWFGKNGVFSGDPAAGTGPAFSGIGSGPFFAGLSVYRSGDAATGRWAASAFQGTIPTGFSAWDS